MRLFLMLFVGMDQPARRMVSIACGAALLVSCSALAQTTIPAGTPFPVQLETPVAMHTGQTVTGKLLHPVYTGTELMLPAGTRFEGVISEVRPDPARRHNAWLNADFTPYRDPTLRFTEVLLPSGAVPISTGLAAHGAPVFRTQARQPAEGSRVHRLFAEQWKSAKGRVSDTKEQITAAGRGNRLRQILYRQLPWHPQQIDAGTLWTAVLDGPLDVPAADLEEFRRLATAAPAGRTKTPPDGTAALTRPVLTIYLDQAISSGSSKPGDSILGTVAEPVLDPEDGTMIPAGARLLGSVYRARPSRTLHRGGKLGFSFHELQLPDAALQNVATSVSGTELASETPIEMSPEGEAQPRPQSKLAVPLLLTFLAGRPLDDDGSQLAGEGVGSNGLGLAGRLLGMAAGSRNLAAGIGFYGAAISVYRRWIRHGTDVTFPQYSRMELAVSMRSGRKLSP